MLKIIVCLVLSQFVVDAKLRSRQATNEPEVHTVPHREYLNTGAFSVSSEDQSAAQYFHDFLRKMRDDLSTHQSSVKGESLSSKEIVLDIPNISFADSLVLRYWSNAEQCSGSVVKMLAQYIGCRKTYDGGSMSMTCLSGRDVRGRTYNSSDCSGEMNAEMVQTLPSCMVGGSYQCNTHSSPAFTEKAGLTTFKFLNAKRCRAFASEMLHFEPDMADDEVDFDDYYRSYLATDDDDSANSSGHYEDADACCSRSELLENCPYPVCSGIPVTSEGRGSHNRAPVVGLGLSSPSSTRHSKRTTAAQDMPVHWWLTQEKKESSASEQEQEQERKHRGLLVTAPTVPAPVRGDAWVREYVISQTRSNVCLYDETYQIWVKTSCNGAKNTLTYQLFADAECHFPMKSVDHLLTDVFPQYGKCAGSSKGDKRTSLLLCNGKNGMAAPVADIQK